MLVINYNDIHKNNIILKNNYKLYYSTENFTLNSININLNFKNVIINYNKCFFQDDTNAKIINDLNVLEMFILNNYYIKKPIYNLKKMLHKNFIYLKNSNNIKNKKFNNVDIILILKGINFNNSYSFINFEFYYPSVK